MIKIRLSAILYTNTLPFVFGLENSDFRPNGIEINFDTPAGCAAKVKAGDVDLGLVPIAAMHEIPDVKIISNYCIGASGNVGSVLLLSNNPLEEIEKVYLDYQSRTSVKLIKVLDHCFWHHNFKFEDTSTGFETKLLKPGEGMVIIGDRAFDQSKKYKFHYDLAGEWKGFTGLPFVFACWVTNKDLESAFVDKFNQALKFGISNIPRVVELYNSRFKHQNITFKEYLNTRISYILDHEKKEAIVLFKRLIEKLPDTY